jgi:hypothetical protein
MEMQLTGNGLRCSRRITVDIPIQVTAEGSPIIHGRLKDLSLSGALVTTDHALRLHAYIEITIKSPRIYCAHRRFSYRRARACIRALTLRNAINQMRLGLFASNLKPCS